MNEAVTQVNVILTAPIPFLIAFFLTSLAAISALYWAFNWRYGAIIEKTRTLWDLTKEDVKRSERAATEATAKLNDTTAKIEELEKELAAAYEKLKQPVPDQVRTLIQGAANSTSSANVLLGQLHQANTAIQENADRGLASTRALFGGQSTVRIDETGVKVVTPKDAEH